MSGLDVSLSGLHELGDGLEPMQDLRLHPRLPDRGEDPQGGGGPCAGGPVGGPRVEAGQHGGPLLGGQVGPPGVVRGTAKEVLGGGLAGFQKDSW